MIPTGHCGHGFADIVHFILCCSVLSKSLTSSAHGKGTVYIVYILADVVQVRSFEGKLLIEIYSRELCLFQNVEASIIHTGSSNLATVTLNTIFNCIIIA